MDLILDAGLGGGLVLAFVEVFGLELKDFEAMCLPYLTLLITRSSSKITITGIEGGELVEV